MISDLSQSVSAIPTINNSCLWFLCPADCVHTEHFVEICSQLFGYLFIYLFILLLLARNHNETVTPYKLALYYYYYYMQASMRQDSETNIIVLNTALNYKIPREKAQTYNYTQTHILKRATQKPER